jgi:nucleoside-diphosphate-sugar epimerase
MKVLITGGSGFIGRHLVELLARQQDLEVILAVRSHRSTPSGSHTTVEVGELHGDTLWKDTLKGVDVVVHCAGRAHVMDEQEDDPLAAFRRVNVDASVALAKAARAASVKRFIYLSSIKVNGEATPEGSKFSAVDDPCPIDPYGISKLEAEQALRALFAGTPTQLVVIRPPLVYGPGVKANFRTLLSFVQRGWPLPFGALQNRRSLVYVGNLTDLIRVSLTHPGAAGHVLLVSDGQDLSTGELVREMANSLQRPGRCLSVPQFLLGFGLRLLGRKETIPRLLGSLRIDLEPTRALLDWTPPYSVSEGMAATTEHYLLEAKRHEKSG